MSIPNFKATTHSGTTYRHQNGIVQIHDKEGWGYAIKTGDAGLIPVNTDHPKFVTEDGHINWPYVLSLPNGIPVIGSCFLVHGFKEWRISSRIERVEILPDVEAPTD